MDYDENRKWGYIEPSDDGVTPVEVIMTEKEILDFYWNFWIIQMKKVGKEHLISKEFCIEDWVVTHWAVEKKEYEYPKSS